MAGASDQNPEMSKKEMEYLNRLYQNQYSIIMNSINDAFSELQELNAAAKTIDNIDKISGKETMHAIGPEVYLMGKFQNSKSVFIGVGAGYILENDIDSAKKLISERITRNKSLVDRLAKTKSELESAINELSSRLG